MNMKKFIIIVLIIGVIAGGGYVLSNKKIGSSAPGTNAASVWEKGVEGSPVSAETLTAGNSKSFKDTARGFSFLYPKRLDATTFPDGNSGDIVLVQSPEKGEGFQILITPYGEGGSNLTAEMIQAEIPDLKISDAQELLLGESGKGVAFISDNDSFAGNSREVWFVYGGNLYQISTYARLDPLLQSVLGTWKFE